VIICIIRAVVVSMVIITIVISRGREGVVVADRGSCRLVKSFNGVLLEGRRRR
jgi:hypothetical protein